MQAGPQFASRPFPQPSPASVPQPPSVFIPQASPPSHPTLLSLRGPQAHSMGMRSLGPPTSLSAASAAFASGPPQGYGPMCPAPSLQFASRPTSLASPLGTHVQAMGPTPSMPFASPSPSLAPPPVPYPQCGYIPGVPFGSYPIPLPALVGRLSPQAFNPAFSVGSGLSNGMSALDRMQACAVMPPQPGGIMPHPQSRQMQPNRPPGMPGMSPVPLPVSLPHVNSGMHPQLQRGAWQSGLGQPAHVHMQGGAPGGCCPVHHVQPNVQQGPPVPSVGSRPEEMQGSCRPQLLQGCYKGMPPVRI